MNYRPSQPAVICDAALKAAVRDLDAARHRAVLWFADIERRRLYRELGFANMAAYATRELKFSKTRTHDFLRLSRKLDLLPAVRESMADGKLGYTKAVEIVKVATPKTEAAWVEKALATGRRNLAVEVKRVKAKALKRKSRLPEMLPVDPGDESFAAEVPLEVRLTMTPEQLARYEALLERLGPGMSDRVETLLAGLESLARDRAAGTSKPATIHEETDCEKPARRRVAEPAFQVHVHRCPDCGRSTVSTRRGEVPLGRADLGRVDCDAVVRPPGGRARSTIAPRVRADVLARDRHRCRAPGCSNTRFLEVHHVTPRSRGGGHEPENLITLCAGCHRFLHEGRSRLPDPGDTGTL